MNLGDLLYLVLKVIVCISWSDLRELEGGYKVMDAVVILRRQNRAVPATIATERVERTSPQLASPVIRVTRIEQSQDISFFTNTQLRGKSENCQSDRHLVSMDDPLTKLHHEPGKHPGYVLG